MKLTEKQQEIFEELFVRYPVLEKNLETAVAARTRSTLSGS